MTTRCYAMRFDLCKSPSYRLTMQPMLSKALRYYHCRLTEVRVHSFGELLNVTYEQSPNIGAYQHESFVEDTTL